MKRTIARIVLFVLVLLLGLIGCSEGNGGEAGTASSPESEESREAAELVEIRMMGLANETRLAVYKNLLETFNAENPKINVTLDHVPGGWDEFNQRLMTQIAGGLPPDIADISIIYRDSFIKEGYLLDIMPYAEADGFDFAKYYDAQFSGVKRDGKLYGVPSGSTLMALYYNKDLFRKAGIEFPETDWNEAWTWDELLAVARRMTTGEGPMKVYGFATNYNIGWFFPTFYQNNADFVSKDGSESTMTDPKAVETLQYIYDLTSTSSPSLSSLKTMEAAVMFKTGRVAMYMDGNWWMEDFNANIDSFEWGVAALPRKEIVQTGVYVDTFSVIQGSEHPKEAWELLKFFMEEEQQVAGINKGIPPMISVAETMYEELYSYIDESERKVWMEGNDVGRPPTYTDNWAEIVSETNKYLEEMAMGELSVEDTAVAIKAKVDAILDR